MAYIPFFFKIQGGDRILVVGGGTVALAKLEALRSVASFIRVVTETALPALEACLEKNGGELIVASYRAEFLQGCRMVIAATGSAEVNRQIHKDAKALGLAVNVVDTPELCDFIFPAVVERGAVQIAISTAGISPTLARYLKRRIERMLPWNFSALADWIKEKRSTVRRKFDDFQSRRTFWEKFIEGPAPREVLEGNYSKAEALFSHALQVHPHQASAALYLIGAGPGHPDLITVKAAQLTSQADVVLYDRLIPHDLLTRYARRDAEKISVGKSRNNHSINQEQIDRLIEHHLRANRIVVRLKGGDPGIYAHAAEEIAVAVRLGVPYQIVPGITAALGCAATAGIPLTERGGAKSVRFLTLYDESFADEALWHSLSSDETLVFYMSTRHREAVCAALLGRGFEATTPLLLIEQGTTPAHAEYEATIGTFAERYKSRHFLTPALLIVGNVVRWRARHGWKESPQRLRAWFEFQEKERGHAGG